MKIIKHKKTIKGWARRTIYKKRYSGNQLWNYLGYIYDSLACTKNFFLSKQTNGILIENFQSIYFYIPKVASTSLLKAITMIAYGESMNILDVPKLKQNDIINYKNYFKFAFVRNPFDRLVSCYHDKVLVGGIDFGTSTNSFSDFAAEIASIPDKHSNIHFKSQHKFITDRNGNLLTDYIGKFENLEQEYQKICTRMGVKNQTDLQWQNKSMRSRKDYRKFYDERSKNLIMKRYEKDLKLFAYEF